ncbi:papilin [Drosophila virilis]|uniref:BPTI/Kunitz inhibitor domain-containing protein n=1 Tax=Drosophila virilis TaxID=7244 RepID=B4LCF6_DROVI|nr:papilin [Drosophila virilis]EDW68801.1 uncharacterized protein Dvir_GJ12488 [Drosophila virilis]
MKFILILACLALFVAHTQAQARPPTSPPTRACRGGITGNRQVCEGRKNEGSTGRNCSSNANKDMWWYDSTSRSCKKLSYKGCGGNNNRHCTRQACEAKCSSRTLY